jgi:hypothetical protein
MGQFPLVISENFHQLQFASQLERIQGFRRKKMKVQLVFFAFLAVIFAQSDVEIDEEIQRWEDYKVRTFCFAGNHR